MSAMTLAVSAGFGVVSAFVFVLVGRAVQSRPVSADLRGPRDAFALWWFALAGTSLTGLAGLLTAWLQPGNLALFLTWSFLGIALLAAGLWGLLYYLVFLYTNAKGAAIPMAFAYAAFFAFLVYFVLDSGLQALQLGRWAVDPVYAKPPEDNPLSLVLLALILLPQVVGAFAYLTLYWKVEDPVQRRRILLVSLSILVWFITSGTGGLAGGEELRESDVWQVGVRLLGLAAAATIYYAYSGLKPATPSANAMDPTRAAPARVEHRVQDDERVRQAAV